MKWLGVICHFKSRTLISQVLLIEQNLWSLNYQVVLNFISRNSSSNPLILNPHIAVLECGFVSQIKKIWNSLIETHGFKIPSWDDLYSHSNNNQGLVAKFWVCLKERGFRIPHSLFCFPSLCTILWTRDLEGSNTPC